MDRRRVRPPRRGEGTSLRGPPLIDGLQIWTTGYLWILAFLLGFVVRVFADLLFLILLLPCVTFPVASALFILVRVMIWMGLASIYLQAGRAVGKGIFRANLTYFGAVLTGFLVFALVGFIPVLGWAVTEILACTALGLMLLTRFGGRNAAAGPAAPGAPPPGPVRSA